MKIYRVSHRDQWSEHSGYEYFSNKSIAESIQNKENKERGKGGKDSAAQTFDEVEEIEFMLSKKGILDLLNQYAAHPNNG